jgi:hypothetical protein
MEKQLKKIRLNQETIRNLTTEEPTNIAGYFTQRCPTGFTCPECNPPGVKMK